MFGEHALPLRVTLPLPVAFSGSANYRDGMQFPIPHHPHPPLLPLHKLMPTPQSARGTARSSRELRAEGKKTDRLIFNLPYATLAE